MNISSRLGRLSRLSRLSRWVDWVDWLDWVDWVDWVYWVDCVDWVDWVKNEAEKNKFVKIDQITPNIFSIVKFSYTPTFRMNFSSQEGPESEKLTLFKQ